MPTRLDIAEQLLRELLGHPVSLDGSGYGAECPGRASHSTGNGRKDFRVFGLAPSDPIPPTMFCLHKKCGGEIDAANREFRRRVWFAENGHGSYAPRGHWAEGVAPEPKAEKQSRPDIDMEAVKRFTHGVPSVDFAWFRRRSAVDVERVETGEFLNHLYQPGERVLIFTDQRSQGDFLWVASGPALVAANATGGDEGPEQKLRGGFRLSQDRNLRAVASALPKGSKDGVWFLVQPVTGLWAVKADTTIEQGERSVQGKWTRRSQQNVTAWRYFVLESDELDAALWGRVLANLSMPIAAIYTSGGRSIHALVKFEVGSKALWDLLRNQIRQLVCPIGADPAALTAVRLSRAPGCKRGDRMQELLYLNPNPDHRPLRLLPELR